MKIDSPDTSLLNIHFGERPHPDEKPGMSEFERWELRKDRVHWLTMFLDWAALNHGVELLQREDNEWWDIRNSVSLPSLGNSPLHQLLAKYWNIDYSAVEKEYEERLSRAIDKVLEGPAR